MSEAFGWILGIESSCDETAAAVLNNGATVAANLVASQTGLHEAYGGVVPELASRQHMETINMLIDHALAQASLTLADLHGIAVSKGPGLAGALLVGVSTAKALAYSLGIPLVGINHMEGHIYANWLADSQGQSDSQALNHDTRDIPFPLLGLVVSGGHTALAILMDHGKYRLLGQTRDDAAGEVFDKVARAMGLGYPGGPVLDRLAREGDPFAYDLPWTRLKNDPWGFSFSGLKTAVLNRINQEAMRGAELRKADLAASFQETVTAQLAEKALAAANAHGIGRILLAGGVAANSALRQKMAVSCENNGLVLYLPSLAYCTDNAAMIACAGYHRLQAGFRDDLTLNAEPSLGFNW